MKLRAVKEILDANVVVGEQYLDREVFWGCGCELMSDVLIISKQESLLLTGLVNSQVIRTAELKNIKAIVFVRGKSPTPEMIALAEAKGMVLLNTGCSLYISSGLLYTNGLSGHEVDPAL